MPVKAKYIKDLPLKKVLDGSESLLVQDLNGTQQAPLGTIVDEIKQNSQEKVREIESELAQTNAQLSQVENYIYNEEKYNIDTSYSSNGVVTIIDDDGHHLFMTKMKPTLDDKRVKCTLCVSVVESNGAPSNGIMTIEQLKNLESEGFEIASHGSNGILMNMTESQIDSDLASAYNFMRDNDFKGKNILVYNGGNYNDDKGKIVQNYVRKYFKYAFNNFGNNDVTINNMMIGRVDFNAKSLEELKKDVDTYYKCKGYLVLMTHSWMDTFDANKLSQLIDYINSKKMSIVKATEGTKLKCNVLEVGTNSLYGGVKINNNGYITSNMIALDAHTVNREIQDYPLGTTYVSIKSYIAGFTPIPSGLKDYSWAGYSSRMIVTKLSRDECIQQLELNYLITLRYTRKWSKSSNAWSEFKPDFSYINIDVLANVDINKNISNFDKNVTTEFRVAGGALTPNNKAGVMTVHRMNDDAYSYRLFVPFDENSIYKSKWNAGTVSWSEWVQC